MYSPTVGLYRDMRCKYTNVLTIILLFSSVILLIQMNNSNKHVSVTSDSQSSSQGLKVSAGKGGQVFGTLQICKDTRVFNDRVKKIEKTDKHLAEYLRQTRPLSLRVAKLTEMGDTEAGTLPVEKTNITNKTQTVIYNRINKCGSSTLLSISQSLTQEYYPCLLF